MSLAQDFDEEFEELDTPLEQILIWIGFDKDIERNHVIEAFGTELDDFLGLSEDDLTDEIKAFGNRRAKEERLNFGLKRAKYFKGILHWVQDHHRINKPIDISDLDQLSFCRELEVSIGRAKNRKDTAKERQSRAAAAMLDKLKDGKSWDTWEAELINMLNILRGSNGSPLAYVVRDREHEEGMVYDSFDEECISKARLSGPHFKADAKTSTPDH